MNYQLAFKQPQRSTAAPGPRLLELRHNFPSLCFEAEWSIWLNHSWTVAGRCKRCGTKIDHRQFENAPVPPLVAHNEEPDL